MKASDERKRNGLPTRPSDARIPSRSKLEPRLSAQPIALMYDQIIVYNSETTIQGNAAPANTQKEERLSKVGFLLAFTVIFGLAAPAAPAQPAQGKGSDRSVDVTGSLDLPGIGTVNLGERRKEPPMVDPRDDRRPEPPPLYDSERSRYTDKALETIHSLAEKYDERTTKTFDGYEKARQALTTIRVVADIFANDRVFRGVSRTASETLAATREDWGPFDAEKVYGALQTISKLTQ